MFCLLLTVLTCCAAAQTLHFPLGIDFGPPSTSLSAPWQHDTIGTFTSGPTDAFSRSDTIQQAGNVNRSKVFYTERRSHTNTISYNVRLPSPALYTVVVFATYWHNLKTTPQSVDFVLEGASSPMRRRRRFTNRSKWNDNRVIKLVFSKLSLTGQSGSITVTATTASSQTPPALSGILIFMHRKSHANTSTAPRNLAPASPREPGTNVSTHTPSIKPEASSPPKRVPSPPTAKFPVWAGKPSGKSQNFGRSPPSGQHPRLWFGSEDLPKMRSLLLNSSATCEDDLCHKPESNVMGAAAYLYLKMRILTGRYNDPMMDGRSKESRMFDTLKTGSTSSSANSQLQSLGDDIGVDNVAAAGLGYNGMYGLLAGSAFVALIQEDDDFDRVQLSKALSTQCKMHNTFYRQDNTNNFVHDAHVDLGLAYDFLAAFMSEAQRKPCRELIMMMIENRSEYGISSGFTGRPYDWNWNHVGWHEHIVVLALSIYGEPGTKGVPERYLKECLEVQSKLWKYGISEGGYGREEIYYFNLGNMWAQPAQLAIARHGAKYNLVQNDELGDTRIYRQTLYHFYTKTIPATTFISWSGGNKPPYSQVLWNWFWPEDPIAAFNVRHAYTIKLWEMNTLQTAIFATKPTQELTYKQVAEAKKLPLSWFCRDRGRMIARSSWDDDAMTLDFEMRMDAHRAGHIEAKPNTFYLYALNLPWVVKFDTFSSGWEAGSMILIDGEGCGGHKHPDTKGMLPGTWNEYRHDEKGITLGSADATYSYSYERGCFSGMKCVPNPGFKRKDFKYVKDPFYETWMEEDVFQSTMGLVNPVLYAHRTALLVRQLSSPFSLVVDDYNKDGESHEYEWFVNLPSGDFQSYYTASVEAESSSRNEVVLRHVGAQYDEVGSARMLVRLLDWDGTIERDFDFAIQRVKDLRHGDTVDRRVVTVVTKGKAARFKTLFYAFRKGESLPKTRYDARSGLLAVELAGNTANIECVLGPDGRTLIRPL